MQFKTIIHEKSLIWAKNSAFSHLIVLLTCVLHVYFVIWSMIIEILLITLRNVEQYNNVHVSDVSIFF